MTTAPVHLALLAGADNRHAYLRDTVRVSRPYFRSIQILDTGSTDATESLARVDGVNYRRLDDWRDDWPHAYSEILAGIPPGDWFLFLDSDERPSLHLLEHLDADIDALERSALTSALIPGLLHLAGKPVGTDATDLGTLLRTWPATHNQFAAQPCWTKKILVKFTSATYVCANGGHCGYHQWPDRACYMPRYYNHYKSPREIAASTVLCSWSCLESHGVPRDAPEWARHNALRVRTGIMTAGDLLRTVRAGCLAPEWLEFWATLADSPYPALAEYWKFAFSFAFSTEPETTRCGRVCCLYRDEQL